MKIQLIQATLHKTHTIYLSIYLSVLCLSIYLSVHLSIGLPIYLYIRNYLEIHIHTQEHLPLEARPQRHYTDNIFHFETNSQHLTYYNLPQHLKHKKYAY